MAKYEDWPVRLVKSLGNALKEARGSRTAAWLSDRTEELGYRISPTVIAKLDSGHRGAVLSVPEILVLSEAVGIPLIDLLCRDGEELLPAKQHTSAEALVLLSGLPGQMTRAQITRELDRARELLESATGKLNSTRNVKKVRPNNHM